MKIKINLHKHLLKTIHAGLSGDIILVEGDTIMGLLKVLNIDETVCVVTVNKTLAGKNKVLAENDTVAIYPVIIGG